MSKRKTKWRVYQRKGRYYVDLREFGRGRVALKPPGASRGTTDADIAHKLATDLVKELEEEKQTSERASVFLGIKRIARLEEFAAHHLVQKARSGRFTEGWLSSTQRMLDLAIEYFGAERPLHAISVSDVQDYVAFLAARSNGRGGTLSGGTIRHKLNALSNLYSRAQSERAVPLGFNPVAALIDKPVARRREAKWLEVHEASLLLESARTYRAKREDVAMPFLPALVATFLLTGGRESEVLGLEVEDVSFDRRTVTFRPNRWRRLKTRTSHRTIPLWPQLEEVLREHVYGGSAPRVSGLLFPSPRLNGRGMVTDVRKALDAIAERAGWKEGDIRTKMFRHTYCAARLQTLDGGAPVSIYTVAREMGHGGDALVKRVYGHLGEVRHRAEVVEYRVEQHAAKLKDRLAAVRS